MDTALGGPGAEAGGVAVTPHPSLAGSAVTTLAAAIYHGGSRLESIPGLLKQVLTDALWRSYALPGGGPLAKYDDFVTFVEDGLHTTVDTLRDLCRRDAMALTLLSEALVRKPGNPTGANQHRGNGSNTTLSKKERGSMYSLRRLVKNRPDLHARVVAKELSPHKAMVEAGFASKRITIFTDPERAARTLRKHFSPHGLAKLVEFLGQDPNA